MDSRFKLAGDFGVKAGAVLALLGSIAHLPATAQDNEYKGNPAILKRGFFFVLKIQNDPLNKSLTKSDFIEVYYRPIERQKFGEILTVHLPAPANGMSQLVSRTFELNCETGSARFASMAMFDGRWTMDGKELEMKGAKWEIPAENTFAYFAHRLTCGAR